MYFATILRAQNLKVAALLDSDAEGDLAAKQDTLVNALGNKRILRTKDVYQGEVAKVEIEDILRETLLVIAKEQLGSAALLFCLSIFGWNIRLPAVFQAPEPVPYVTFMAAIPAFFSCIIENWLPAVCTESFLAAT